MTSPNLSGESVEDSFRSQYRGERLRRIQRIVKYNAPLYAIIVGGLFIYADLVIAEINQAPWWRLPSVGMAVALLVLINTRWRDTYSVLFVSYVVFLSCICLMMAGLTWMVFPDGGLERTLSGVLLAIFAVYVGAVGGYKTMILVYLPLLLVPFFLYLTYHPAFGDVVKYANPIALILACLVGSQLEENLRFKEFKNRKIAENERMKANRALANLLDTQTQLIHSEKMASLGELTAGIAHEIQNPLNFVNNFSDINKELIDELKEEIDLGNSQEAKSIADDIAANEEKIAHHGKRAEEIVKSMLQHSREGDGEKQFTDINELADEYVRLAYHGLRAKDPSFNTEIKTDFDPNLPAIEVVPQDIGRVLLNLLNNAFAAVSEKAKSADIGYTPTVQLKTTFSPSGGGQGEVQITVSDNGPGIPEDIRDKIFQPFFTTKPTGEGTGLGLSLSYDIVTKGHGGNLEIDTAASGGAAFCITLPVHEGH